MEKVHYIKQTNGQRNLFYYPNADEIKISSIPGKKVLMGIYPDLEGKDIALTLLATIGVLLILGIVYKFEHPIKNHFIVCIAIIVLSFLCGFIYKKTYDRRIEKTIVKEDPKKYSMKKTSKLYTKSLIKSTFFQAQGMVLVLLVLLWIIFNTNSFFGITMCGICILGLVPLIIEVDFVGRAKLICRLKKEKQ